MAKKVNMTQQRISAYEKGKREPDIETIKQFADFFGVTIDYLLGKSNIQNSQQEEYSFAYHKETEGLTEEEIKDALKFYKEMKNKIKKNDNNKENNNGKK